MCAWLGGHTNPWSNRLTSGSQTRHTNAVLSVCELSSGISSTHNCTCTLSLSHTHTFTLSSFIRAGQLFVYSSRQPEALRESHLFSLLCKPLFVCCVSVSILQVFHYQVFSLFYVTMLHCVITQTHKVAHVQKSSQLWECVGTVCVRRPLMCWNFVSFLVKFKHKTTLLGLGKDPV